MREKLIFAFGLVLWMCSSPDLPLIFCSDWATKDFFVQLDVKDISRCFGANADLNVQDNVMGDAGATPLHAAVAWSKNPDVMRVLLDAGADVNAKEDHGIPSPLPLHLAVTSLCAALPELGTLGRRRAAGLLDTLLRERRLWQPALPVRLPALPLEAAT